jgi:hypothetical protein
MLASIWRRQWAAHSSVEQIEALYAELGAEQRARTLLETYKEEAIRCLRDLENPNLKGLLRRVLGKIFNDVEIKGWCKEHEQTQRQAQTSAPSDLPAANPENSVPGG